MQYVCRYACMRGHTHMYKYKHTYAHTQARTRTHTKCTHRTDIFTRTYDGIHKGRVQIYMRSSHIWHIHVSVLSTHRCMHSCKSAYHLGQAEICYLDVSVGALRISTVFFKMRVDIHYVPLMCMQTHYL